MKNIINSITCLKCKACCYFDKQEKYLAPYFSREEFSKISNSDFKRCFNKKSDNLFQIKLCKAAKRGEDLRCPLLDEKKHRCLIYEKRPFECRLWPFFIGWDKRKKNIFLYKVNESWCKFAIIDDATSSYFIDYFMKYFTKNKIFSKIKKGDIVVWPYRPGHKKIKNITQFIF